ncbi:RRM domain-containing protein [Tumidithrix helvetica PCC 7403]|uniref:ABC transporter substrate-binding protein n=1 Tax=Tumidithrix helvetica TaxID=3457545 RepID=UPI003CBF7A8D
MSYDATQAIATGLQQSDSREGLQQALTSSSFSADGASGKIQFRKTGDRSGRGILVKVEPGNQSGTGYDFVPIPDTSTQQSN